MALTKPDAETLEIILEGIFYGAYLVLFIQYLALRCRSNRGLSVPLPLAQILLFGLCTVSLCLDIPWDYFDVVPDVANKDSVRKVEVGSMAVFVAADWLAQMILLYRCWIIWDRRWAVVAAPGFLALVALGDGFDNSTPPIDLIYPCILGLGFALVALSASPLWSTDLERTAQPYKSIAITTYATSLGVNALTTSLIVVKIFLTSREARRGLDSDSYWPARIVTAMLIESGLLIFGFQLVFVIFFSAQLPALHIISGPMIQVYGIAPTLLGIWVVMGSAYDKTTEKTRSLRFVHSRGATAWTTGPGISSVVVRSEVIDIDLDDISHDERATDLAV